MNKERFLVTTALEDTWPCNNEPILFLGEWCRLYNRKAKWENLDAKVLPYQWDDRVKLYEDYKYLQDILERLLIELTVRLNKIHEVDYDSRYWRIIIGPWLMSFLSIIYERWQCVSFAIDTYSISGTKIYEGVSLNKIPSDMEHFSKLSASDEWNHLIYSSILKYKNYNEFINIKRTASFDQKLEPVVLSVSIKKDIINKIKNIYSYVSSYISRSDSYVLVTTYLSKFECFKLQLKLHQFPVFFQSSYCESSVSSSDYRQWSISGFKRSKFEEFISEIIPFHTPLTYLEGYKKLIDHIDKSSWPKRPKLIWTSNSFFMDEQFKVWSAIRVNEGVPLVIGQHGGHYGQGLFSFIESHELKICDHYLSWGWESNDHKVIPVASVKQSIQKKRERNKDKQDTVLLIISGTSRYSGAFNSMPISKQWLDYFNDQKDFFENLPSYISDDVITRLYPSDYNWSQYARWKDAFPMSHIDQGKLNINEQFLKTKLVVSGWNSTVYLQSMLSDIPTLMFWQPGLFEVRSDARASFDDLRRVGILHDTPCSAVNHLVKIWDDIDAWWNHDDVVAVRNDFKSKYVRPYKAIDEFSLVLSRIAENQQEDHFIYE